MHPFIILLGYQHFGSSTMNSLHYHGTIVRLSAYLALLTMGITSEVVAFSPAIRAGSPNYGCHHRQNLHAPPTASVIFMLHGEDITADDERIQQEDSSGPILCDLQTLLRLTGSLDTGGSAKVAIQSGTCKLNGDVETRRAKKLFNGDVVTFRGKEYNVEQVVLDKNYVYKPKEKKIKPEARVDEFGNREFGGRFRSDEWRAERKQKKLERKKSNAATKDD